MKVLYLIFGFALLAIATPAIISLNTNFEMLRDVLANGTPVLFWRGYPVIPGRIYGAYMILVPAVLIGAGIWLLVAAFDKKNTKPEPEP